MATDYGTDLKCLDDLDLNAAEIEGVDVVAQDAYHELISARGSIIGDPDAGEDVGSFLEATVAPGFVQTIPGRISNALLRDPRIDDVQATAESTDGGQSVECRVAGTTGKGPFRLVFTLAENTVSLAKES